MRITAKGQVTIPIALREKAGLLPHTEVNFELDGDAVRIVKGRAPRARAGANAPSASCAAAVRCG